MTDIKKPFNIFTFKSFIIDNGQTLKLASNDVLLKKRLLLITTFLSPNLSFEC